MLRMELKIFAINTMLHVQAKLNESAFWKKRPRFCVNERRNKRSVNLYTIKVTYRAATETKAGLDYEKATVYFDPIPEDVANDLCIAVKTERKKRSKAEQTALIHFEAYLESVERVRKRMYVPNSIESVEIIDAEENGD